MAKEWTPDDEQDDEREIHAVPISELFGAMHRQQEPTTEEKEKYEQELYTAKKVGELVFSTLPVFNESTPCLKCGCIDYSIEYSNSSDTVFCARQTGTHSHLHRKCTRCGYVWIERTLDPHD